MSGFVSNQLWWVSSHLWWLWVNSQSSVSNQLWWLSLTDAPWACCWIPSGLALRWMHGPCSRMTTMSVLLFLDGRAPWEIYLGKPDQNTKYAECQFPGAFAMRVGCLSCAEKLFALITQYILSEVDIPSTTRYVTVQNQAAKPPGAPKPTNLNNFLNPWLTSGKYC